MENTLGTFTEKDDKKNTASISNTISYQTTITVGKGAENYKLYDVMDDGLTFNNDITVKLNGELLDEEAKDYEITESTLHSFEIEFNIVLDANDVILVEYTATLNQNAVNGTTGNKNETWLEYGNSHTITHDTTTTYTYSAEVVKIDGADNRVLEGAKFKLYDSNGRIYVVKGTDGAYYVTNESNEVELELESGFVTIKGLDANTYYLEETRNPDGYAKLLDRHSFTITNDNLDATLNETIEDEKTTYTYVEGGVAVTNTKGDLLPETGGIGTVIFITTGSLMVTLFGLLLVTKYRMSKMDI